MKKTSLLVAAACGAISLLNSATVANAADSAKPNILFILTDDQGYGDWSINGHPLLKTPNVDRLAKQSVRLENFYVSPSCSPTRAALLTGMHEFRSGVTHTQVPREELWKGAITLLKELVVVEGGGYLVREAKNLSIKFDKVGSVVGVSSHRGRCRWGQVNANLIVRSCRSLLRS